MTAPSIVQSAFARNNSTTATLTLGSAPTAGNLMLLIVSGYWGSTNTPTGYTLVAFNGDNFNNQTTIFKRTAQVGDSASLTVTWDTDYRNLALFEITGANNGVVQASHGNPTVVGGTMSTASGLPTYTTDTLRFVAFEMDNGPSNISVNAPLTEVSPGDAVWRASGNHAGIVCTTTSVSAGALSVNATVAPNQPVFVVIDVLTAVYVSPGATDIWDSTSLVNTTLDGTSLIATNVSGSTSFARARNAVNHGKYYFEVTLSAIGYVYTGGVGLSIPTATASDISTGNKCIFIEHYGPGNQAYLLGTQLYNNALGAYVAVVGVAVDFGAKLAWLRADAGAGYNNGSADPALGTGGYDITPLLALSPSLVPVVGSSYAMNWTANFGASQMAGVVPSGFTAGWPYQGVVNTGKIELFAWDGVKAYPPF